MAMASGSVAMALRYIQFASQVKEPLMDKETFETIDPILDDIAEVANELLNLPQPTSCEAC